MARRVEALDARNYDRAPKGGESAPSEKWALAGLRPYAYVESLVPAKSATLAPVFAELLEQLQQTLGDASGWAAHGASIGALLVAELPPTLEMLLAAHAVPLRLRPNASRWRASNFAAPQANATRRLRRGAQIQARPQPIAECLELGRFEAHPE
jgi:hypothetical protein